MIMLLVMLAALAGAVATFNRGCGFPGPAPDWLPRWLASDEYAECAGRAGPGPRSDSASDYDWLGWNIYFWVPAPTRRDRDCVDTASRELLIALLGPRSDSARPRLCPAPGSARLPHRL